MLTNLFIFFVYLSQGAFYILHWGQFFSYTTEYINLSLLKHDSGDQRSP